MNRSGNIIRQLQRYQASRDQLTSSPGGQPAQLKRLFQRLLEAVSRGKQDAQSEFAAAASDLIDSLLLMSDDALRLAAEPRSAMSNLENFGIKAGYKSRSTPARWAPDPSAEIIHQPEVYLFAAAIARAHGCDTIIDIGSGDLRKLAPLRSEFRLIAIDTPQLVGENQNAFGEIEFIAWDLEQDGTPALDDSRLKQALIICSDVIEHLVNPISLLNLLELWMKTAPVAVVSTPERDLARGYHDFGPPYNPLHVREWNRAEFSKLLRAAGLREIFSGLTLSNTASADKSTILSVLGNHHLPRLTPAPADFRIIALMAAYNEADVLAPTLARLNNQGIDVCFIDNWSDDGTYEIAEQFVGKGVIHLERFPAEGRSEYHEWPQILDRKEALSREFAANWYIHHDVDEVLESPWQGVSLRDAFYYVDQCGFNTINFSALNFRPIDEQFAASRDFAEQFHYFELGRRQWYGWLLRAWKNLAQPAVRLSEYTGHTVSFEGRRIYPYRFLLRHYPIRSTAHGQRKVLQQRRKRPELLEAGLGVHYAGLNDAQSLIHRPENLIHFDASFYATFLVERLVYEGRVVDQFQNALGY